MRYREADWRRNKEERKKASQRIKPTAIPIAVGQKRKKAEGGVTAQAKVRRSNLYLTNYIPNYTMNKEIESYCKATKEQQISIIN